MLFRMLLNNVIWEAKNPFESSAIFHPGLKLASENGMIEPWSLNLAKVLL